MIPINYHHLYYFWTVARLGSISAARKQLYLSQPTLSGQIKELERACNAKLFNRSRHGVSLTFEGRIVFERCEKIFSEGNDLVALIKNGFKMPSMLRVGIRPTVSRKIVLRTLAFARETEKTCRVKIFSGEAGTLLDKLKAESVDIIIANQDYSSSLGKNYRSRLVSRLPVYFVASRAVKKVVRKFPEDLAKTSLLLRPDDNPVRKQIEEFLARKRVRSSVEADSDDVGLLRRMTVDGRGVGAFSTFAVASDLKLGRLVMLHPAPIGIEEQIWFICRSRPQTDPTTRRVIQALMSSFTIFGKIPKVKSHLGN